MKMSNLRLKGIMRKLKMNESQKEKKLEGNKKTEKKQH